MKQVGKELGVLYVLEGSVRKAGNRVRITAKLLDATTGAHLWGERFDATIEHTSVRTPRRVWAEPRAEFEARSLRRRLPW